MDIAFKLLRRSPARAGSSERMTAQPAVRPAPARARLAAIALGAGLLAACQSSAPDGAEGLRFPAPDRPVARIISSAYSDEETRDRNGEAERVMDRLGIAPGVRVADIGAGDGYYTARLARRLGPGAVVYAEDVEPKYLKGLEERLARERIAGVRLILAAPRDPKLPPASIDVALLSHMYHEIENPYEFLYRLHPALRPNARVGVIDNDRPTQDHGTPPALLRCELAAVGYRQVDFLDLTPAEGYLAVFEPPANLPPVASITPCRQESSRRAGALLADMPPRWTQPRTSVPSREFRKGVWG